MGRGGGSITVLNIHDPCLLKDKKVWVNSDPE